MGLLFTTIIVQITLQLTLLSLPSSVGLPLKQTTHLADVVDPVKYLKEFGWLNDDDGNQNEEMPKNYEKLTQELKDFQAFAGINVTGILDKMTLDVMHLPRCGELDRSNSIVDKDNCRPENSSPCARLRRKKRFILHGSRWKIRNLNYSISKYSTKLSRSEVDETIARAFQQWENAANISFRQVHGGKVHIDIKFETGNHGDDDNFDGPGLTTAHAYFPEHSGSIHFDDDENWTTDFNGVNLLQVATHEIGHALGLEHSNVPNSVMAPFYRYSSDNVYLKKDDVLGIQAIYGKRITTFCDDPRIDAATTMINNQTYLFKGLYVYTLDVTTMRVTDTPKAISAQFPGLPGNLDAAITRPNGVSYFFKGDEFWRVTKMSVDSGFPRKISEYFPGIDGPVDAAFVLSNDNNIYFFKESKYWKFDHRKVPPVETGYPIYIVQWSKHLPHEKIDAVLSTADEYNNPFTYIFKKNQFWKFVDKSFSVYLADPPYPRLVSTDIFGCTL